MTLRAYRPVSAVLAGAAAAAWSLLAASPAEDKSQLPQVPRFPFGEGQARQFRDDYAKAAGLPKEVGPRWSGSPRGCGSPHTRP